MTDTFVTSNEFDIPGYLDDAIRTVFEGLKAVGIDNPRLDARLIVSYAAGVPAETYLIKPKMMLDAAIRDCVAGLMMRRLLREPMSHILGQREFWSMMFEVTPDTLTPRPDTECLVESALKAIRNRQWPGALSILDIGTGSGCILLSLLSELPDATGVGADINPEALSVARRNAIRHGMEGRADFLVSDCFDSIEKKFDMIVSNPPYIKTEEIASLDPEVSKYEPLVALDGGNDGLFYYRELCEKAPKFLKKNGVIAVEVGVGQDVDVTAIFERFGASSIQLHQDLTGRDRVVMATYS